MSSNATRQELVRLFKAESTIQQHVDAHARSPAIYSSELLALISAGVSVSSVTKARAAAILWRAGDRATVKSMLFEKSTMGIVEVLGMVKYLDSGRKASRIEKEISKNKRMKLTKRLTLTKEAQALRADSLPNGGCGASGALMKHIRRWIGKIDSSALEFFLLARPKEPWMELADLCHAKPSNFQLDYFLPSVFGSEAPAGSIHALADECKTAEDIPRLLDARESFASCYSWIRTKFPPQSYPVATKEALAAKIPLEEALWYYEELCGGNVDSILTERIGAGEALVEEGKEGRGHANFGKLMERLLLFQRRNAPFASLLIPRAEQLLKEVGMNLARGRKVAVLGDASSSMQVAIDSAAIIAASITSCFDAELSFFHSSSFKPHLLPRNAEQTLEVASLVKAGGCTANAASLLPFYQSKQEVDLFVMVTDEEENTRAGGMFFHELFDKYVKEVYPHAKVFFVSFIRPTDPGHMVALLNARGLGERVKQFKFDPARPDLSKLNSLLGMIAMELSDDVEMPTDGEEVEAIRAGVSMLTCLDGEVPVPAGATAAVAAAFPKGTSSVPVATLHNILPSLVAGEQAQGG
mmetsp:Transcript_37827/g.77674  ORF Transcript_37827/g.77674 Transcript_37827/m.77674 type:complete len:583 (-) Transcript_37827:40-1788(-)|eukprot:CAMPEP_0181308872 /NCGR_PEP_ID=MMETSP1101-20121128/11709_1 /TAXON_ID=46948 /ORGANISM="Rhodomonas abbreviata, Strain Caron Lab Isolate" /LENGTH=582 /DNA_ID=CAMNT_0023415313 /DNA_START=106 /DNA_END=1854 /DNA_ORIENTATION=+